MKYPKACWYALPVCLAVCAGCSNANSTAATDAKMRAAYQTKGFKQSDIPPNQRAIVEGYMKAGKGGAVPAVAASPK